MSEYFCCCRSIAARQAEKKARLLCMERERKEGQALLRSMATGSNDKVDWQAIIKKAEELHKREQEWLRQHDSHERRLFVQRQRRALQKRRKYDSIGSFSINMLTYSTEPTKKESRKANASVTSSVGSTKEDHDEEVSSMGSHGAPASRNEAFTFDVTARASTASEAKIHDARGPNDRFITCASSSSSFMDIFEDQLHGPDSDSI
ncbi:hypothetical protein MHU86_17292 [Fragilaria crotonensis]|nr:hypothetical protein MHU86_17292 [Fragilaria crotonensis]